jgi:hypothetical protein
MALTVALTSGVSWALAISPINLRAAGSPFVHISLRAIGLIRLNFMVRALLIRARALSDRITAIPQRTQTQMSNVLLERDLT